MSRKSRKRLPSIPRPDFHNILKQCGSGKIRASDLGHMTVRNLEMRDKVTLPRVKWLERDDAK